MPKVVDPDTQLAERLLTWHKPSSDGVSNSLDAVRSRFLSLAKFVIKTAPASPDRTRAIEAIGDASRQAIFAIVAHQEPTPVPVPDPEPAPAPQARKAARGRKAAK